MMVTSFIKGFAIYRYVLYKLGIVYSYYSWETRINLYWEAKNTDDLYSFSGELQPTKSHLKDSIFFFEVFIVVSSVYSLE